MKNQYAVLTFYCYVSKYAPNLQPYNIPLGSEESQTNISERDYLCSMVSEASAGRFEAGIIKTLVPSYSWRSMLVIFESLAGSLAEYWNVASPGGLGHPQPEAGSQRQVAQETARRKLYSPHDLDSGSYTFTSFLSIEKH